MSRRAVIVVLVLLGCGLAVLLLRGGASRGDAVAPAAGASVAAAGERDSQSPTVADVPAPARAPTADRNAESLHAPTASDQAEHVVVVVTDTLGTAVANATVEITGEGPLGSHLADTWGMCPLPVVVGNGSVQLRVSAAGFVPYGIRHSLGPTIPITLDRALTVRGRVTDSASHAIAAARVRCTIIGAGEQALTTNADGSFEMSGVPEAKPCTWVIGADGFVSKQDQRGVVDSQQSLVFELEPGIPIVLDIVGADTGLPIADATATRLGDELRSDASGRIATTAFLGTTEGRTALSIIAKNFCRVNAVVHLGEATVERPLRVQLVRTCTLDGFVRSASGAPIADTTLRLESDRWRRMSSNEAPAPVIELPPGWSLGGEHRSESFVTTAAGSYHFDGLDPRSANYRLVVIAPERDVVVRDIENTGEPGATTQINVDLPDRGQVGSVNGKVMLNGKPCYGFVRWQGRTRDGSGQIEPNGSFRLESVECGSVKVTPDLPKFMRSERCLGKLADGKTIVVDPNAVASVDFEVTIPTATISGRVTRGNSEPAEGVVVSAWARNTCLGGEAKTEADGTFALEVDSEEPLYTVQAGEGAERVTQSEVAPGTKGLGLVLHGTARVRVRVVDSNSSEALTQFHLRFRGEGGDQQFDTDSRPSSIASDRSGWYVIEVAQGRYELTVTDSLTEITDYLPPAPISVDVSANPDPIEVRRSKGEACMLQLAADQVRWPDDVVVVLVESRWYGDVDWDGKRWNAGPALTGYGLAMSRMVRFDESGRARIRKLNPGPYRFKAMPPTIVVEPAEIQGVPVNGEPLVIRWRKN
jgi:hypothetical protein